MDTPFNLNETDKLLSTTRAVRRRLDFDKPVAQQTILDCIALAQQAPTATNQQTWRWIVVTDQDKRRQIADCYKAGAPMVAKSRSQKGKEDQQTQKVYNATEYLLEHMQKVPVLVFPCVQGKTLPDAHPCVLASIYGSIFPAVWSFQLALRSRGLGSTLTTLHLLQEQEIANILGLPDDLMQVAMLPVAYTKGGDFKPAVRPGPETITHWDHW